MQLKLYNTELNITPLLTLEIERYLAHDEYPIIGNLSTIHLGNKNIVEKYIDIEVRKFGWGGKFKRPIKYFRYEDNCIHVAFNLLL